MKLASINSAEIEAIVAKLIKATTVKGLERLIMKQLLKPAEEAA